jgi:hypothetical protein
VQPSRPGNSEFTFELLVCRWAELSWPPDADAARRPVVVARQLGTRERRWDTVVVEVDPDAFATRLQLDDRGFDSDLLHVVRNAPADWTWYRDALPDPGYPWRYVRAAVHRAAARGAIEERKSGGRVELRRVAPYPDWVRRIVAVENKPDLDASAARALADQLRHDVDAGLADEAWVATAATGEPVEPALLNEMPVEAGVLAVSVDGGTGADDGDGAGPAFGPAARIDAEVLWYPGTLSPDPGRADTRLELAERAFDRGWRSYLDAVRPDCRWFQLRHVGRATLPYCAAKGCHQSSAACAGSCGDFQPEPPAWRTRGPPIEGGPGKGIRRVLDGRRERVRSRVAGGVDDGD